MMSAFVETEFVERMNEEEGAEGQEAQPSTVPQDFFTSSPQYTLAQDTVYFCDGVRRIDFILAFDDEVHSQDAINNQKKRTEFQASLMKMGLDLEIEPKEESVSGRTTFVKVHAPWNPLTTYAEILHIQVPLKESDLPLVSGSDSGPLHYLGNIHHLKPGAVPKQTDYFTAPFRRSQQDIYPIKDHDVLIPPAVRSQIVHYMLQSPMPQDSTKILNISQMTENGCYTAAYPLHDSESAHPTKNPNTLGDRNTLRREWARAGRSFKEQPLDLVRSYFGEQVGLYFAWLGFYTKMLIFAAIVGLINFLFGVFSKDRDITSGEICNNTIGGSLVMCPQCDQKCTFWRLNDTCETVKTSHMYENPVTIFFAVFMGLWATVFLEFWKRRQASLAYRWDLTAAAEEGDPIRPEYLARCTTTKCNIITMEEEPHMPKRILRFRSCLSGIMVLFWILLILAAILGVVVYRLSIFGILSSSIPNHVTKIKVIGALLTPDMVTTITASILNIVIILLLNKGYNKLALVLTDLEMPKTQGEYEYRLTFKKFLFQFVNFYSASFYIAFFKGKFIGFPGSYTYFGKWRIEECSPNGCLFELTSQLAVIMVVKQMVGNFQEVIIPWFSNWWAQRQAKLRPEAVYTRWEQDMDLQPQSPLGLFDEYLEMVIQFGFVTLFVASFPLAPLLALLNNIIEVRVDAWKLVTKMRRPVVSRASGIGAWADILSIVATLSVITNSCILAFTTDIIPRLVYYYGYSADYGTGSPTMHGYTEDSLSIFKISDFKEQNRPNILPAWFDPAIHTTCRYPGYRYPPDHPQAYSITKQYWKVLMAKLAFVIVMQHVVLLTKACIAYIIPDTPSHVRACMRRERFVVQTMLQQAELGRLRNTLLTDAPGSRPSPQFHVENEQAGTGLRRCPLHAESPGVSHPPQRCHMENDQAKKTGDDSLLKGSVEESSSEDSSTVFYSV